MFLTEDQYQRLAAVGRAREQLKRHRARVVGSEAVMRRACADAVAAGISLRRIAAVADASHETVRMWAIDGEGPRGS